MCSTTEHPRWRPISFAPSSKVTQTSLPTTLPFLGFWWSFLPPFRDMTTALPSLGRRSIQGMGL